MKLTTAVTDREIVTVALRKEFPTLYSWRQVEDEDGILNDLTSWYVVRTDGPRGPVIVASIWNGVTSGSPVVSVYQGEGLEASVWHRFVYSVLRDDQADKENQARKAKEAAENYRRKYIGDNKYELR